MSTLFICEFIALFMKRMNNSIIFYYRNRLVDNLPVATRILNPDTMELQFEHGYRLGKFDGKHDYINNHLKLILSYHMHTK